MFFISLLYVRTMKTFRSKNETKDFFKKLLFNCTTVSTNCNTLFLSCYVIPKPLFVLHLEKSEMVKSNSSSDKNSVPFSRSFTFANGKQSSGVKSEKYGGWFGWSKCALLYGSLCREWLLPRSVDMQQHHTSMQEPLLFLFFLFASCNWMISCSQ